MKNYTNHYINGQWVKAQSGKVFEVHDSTTEEVFATVPQGTKAEAEQAVLAARAAFDSWSQLPVETRCGFIDKITLHNWIFVIFAIIIIINFGEVGRSSAAYSTKLPSESSAEPPPPEAEVTLPPLFLVTVDF